MTNPVQFLDGVQSMYNEGQGPDVLIEIGPHSALESPIRDILKSNGNLVSKVRYLSALSRGQDALATILDLTSALFVLGCDLDFRAVNHPMTPLPTLIADLPAYPWNHSKRYWHESRLSLNHRLRRFARSDILGSLVDDYNDLEPSWRNLLRITDMPWLTDHKVQGSVIFPLVGYLTMAMEGAFQHAMLHQISINAATHYNLRDVKISRSMVLSEGSAIEVSLGLRPHRRGSRSASDVWNEFIVHSYSQESGWVEHCQGLISISQSDSAPNAIDEARQTRVKTPYHQELTTKHDGLSKNLLEAARIYSMFAEAGLDYGPVFRNIKALYAGNGCSKGTVTVPDTVKSIPYGFENIHIIHPGTLDACIQMICMSSEPPNCPLNIKTHMSILLDRVFSKPSHRSA